MAREDVSTLAARWHTAVRSFGSAAAARDDATTLSYAELDRLQNAIGAAVAARVPPGGVVAVVASKRVWALAAMLGVANHGRAALLLDPAEPAERWADHCRRVDAQLVVADRDAGNSARGLGIDQLSPSDCEGAPRGPDGQPLPDADAWILCTSGSTGAPKLVATSHRLLAQAWDRMLARVATYGHPGARVMVFPGLALAAARVPLFQALGAGACAVLVDGGRTAPSELVSLIRDNELRRVYLDPSVFTALVVAATREEPVMSVDRFELAGGLVAKADVQAGRKCFPRATFTIHYGSTELGSVSTVSLAPHDRLGDGLYLAMTLIDGVRVRILDEVGESCAPRVAGEIWVCATHAFGAYRDDPALVRATTRVDDDGTTWTNTGDVGCVLVDGRLEVHGRVDARVKVNGLAVDLNAVTAAVRALDGVADAEVSPVGEGDDTQLVAWVVRHDDWSLTVRDLRVSLARTLPRFMIPRVFRAISEIPRLPGGKVDRVALRVAAAAEVPLGAPTVAPATETEIIIAGLFADQLDRGDIGVHESFFELGGDSLAALEVVTAVVDRLSLSSDQRLAFETQLMSNGTIAALAAGLEAHDDGPGDVVSVVRPDGVGVLVLNDSRAQGMPVVLLPGGGQNLLSLRPIVGHLGDMRVWALTPRGYRTRGRTDPTIEAMAQRYADTLLALDPRGQFVLAGFSFGGVVAYALATVLVARGASVPVLTILDARRPGASGAPAADGLPKPLGAIVSRSVSQPWQRIPRAAARRARRRYLGVSAGLVRRRGSAQGEAFLARAGQLLSRFQPVPYAGRVVIVRNEMAAAAGVPPDLGWASVLTGSWTGFDSPGPHLSTLLEPTAGRVAAVLSAAMAAPIDPTMRRD